MRPYQLMKWAMPACIYNIPWCQFCHAYRFLRYKCSILLLKFLIFIIISSFQKLSQHQGELHVDTILCQTAKVKFEINGIVGAPLTPDLSEAQNPVCQQQALHESISTPETIPQAMPNSIPPMLSAVSQPVTLDAQQQVRCILLRSFWDSLTTRSIVSVWPY